MTNTTMSELLVAYNAENKRAHEEIMKRCLNFVQRRIFANNIDCPY
jgi:DNA-directed RNA polymerase specialized sigma subunit